MRVLWIMWIQTLYFLVDLYASINVKPEGGGGGHICGAFDFSEEFLFMIPTVGLQNWVKSDQISPPWGSNIP